MNNNKGPTGQDTTPTASLRRSRPPDPGDTTPKSIRSKAASAVGAVRSMVSPSKKYTSKRQKTNPLEEVDVFKTPGKGTEPLTNRPYTPSAPASNHTSSSSLLDEDTYMEQGHATTLPVEQAKRELSQALATAIEVAGHLSEDDTIDQGIIDAVDQLNSMFKGSFIEQMREAVRQELEFFQTTVENKMTTLTNRTLGSIKQIEDKTNKTNEKMDALEKSIQELKPTIQAIQTTSHTAPRQSPSKPQATTQATTPKTQLADPTDRDRKTSSNPLNAHHPARLVIQMIPEGISPDERPDPRDLVDQINRRLLENPESRNLVVAAVKWNSHGNCILIMRADQNAKELIKFKDRFIDLITKGRTAEVREDKKWYKVQVNGIRTGAYDPIPTVYTPEDISKELFHKNPIYKDLKLVQPPRWMRSAEELRSQAYSSVVIALEDEEQFNHLTREVRTLAAFGRNCILRRYADRPPVTQCKKCWRFDHITHECPTDKIRCRLCDGPHSEEDHKKDCKQCEAVREGEGDVFMDGYSNSCDHNLRCAHCKDKADNKHPSDSRRCPERIARYGSARNNDKTTKSQHQRDELDDGWTTVMRKRGKGPRPVHRDNTGTEAHDLDYGNQDEERNGAGPSVEKVLADPRLKGVSTDKAKAVMSSYSITQ
jgi:hypothetical protein